MAKYTITHTCNHRVEVQLFGSEAGRRRQIAAMSDRKCAACAQAEASTAHAEINAAAAQASAATGLPALTGSDKQVAWATTVRLTALQTIEAHLDAATKKAIAAGVADDKIAAGREMAAKILARARTITEASWWIDQRQSDAEAITMAVYKMI